MSIALFWKPYRERTSKSVPGHHATIFPKTGSVMHSRYVNLLARSSNYNSLLMTMSESISPWTKQWIIYFLPYYWLFLVVLMFLFQSWQELVWGGLNYSCIQRGSISCLAGSNINWKRKPTCRQREMQSFLVLPLPSSILINLVTSTCLSAC